VSGIETAQTFLKPEQAAVMVEEYVAGAPMTAMAVKYGVHVATVRAHAHKAAAARPEQITDEVLADFTAGVGADVLAQRCGVPAAAIRRFARLSGVKAGSTKPCAGDVAEMVALYGQGARIIEVGRQFHIGTRRARQVLADAGVAIRPASRSSSLTNQRALILELRGQGWSFVQIGEHLGIPSTTVRDNVKRWADKKTTCLTV